MSDEPTRYGIHSRDGTVYQVGKWRDGHYYPDDLAHVRRELRMLDEDGAFIYNISLNVPCASAPQMHTKSARRDGIACTYCYPAESSRTCEGSSHIVIAPFASASGITKCRCDAVTIVQAGGKQTVHIGTIAPGETVTVEFVGGE